MIFRAETYTNNQLVASEQWDSVALTYARSVNGSTVEARPLTPAEQITIAERVAAVTANTTASTLEQRARTAVTNNRAFLAVAAPTNAQVVAQVKALTRQMNGLIQLAVARDTLTDGTLD